jgi:hypothetical protein
MGELEFLLCPWSYIDDEIKARLCISVCGDRICSKRRMYVSAAFDPNTVTTEWLGIYQKP